MTAVDFLVETIDKKYINAFITRIVEQAKEMEKQQIIDAFEDGYSFGYRDNGKMGSEYYNETFKK
jgi:hypothetical protein